MPDHNDVLKFWFETLSGEDWWKKSDALDQRIKEQFGELLSATVAGECYHWRSSAEGRLAEIIVLDQFSRNIFRDTPASFSQDPMALTLSQQAVSQGDHVKLPSSQAVFTAMPFMHSESAIIHQRALEVFTVIGNPDNLKFEIRHKEIIDRYGRYPHRNAILGRQSSSDELAFLSQPGSSF